MSVVVASRLKKATDKHLTQFSGTYKIRQEIAAKFLSELLALKENLRTKYRIDKGRVDDSYIEAIRESQAVLYEQLALAGIYFNIEVEEMMASLAIADLHSMETNIKILQLPISPSENPEIRNQIVGIFEDQLKRSSKAEVELTFELKKVLAPD